ncbi:hypothetical protein HYPBUDRAFT_128913 [Hyphopichia burtonii NRRL Y-1933]|uniref:E3 ubiquitin-protein ligase listerin n=1 Tax=Hyphopichia burtonii NRRL Y-1933 TaxID=984485 RepID=A0A1E4RES0_9ASCO|nr:hypothetical protein HYPBUDRAFT_128913 [Hyphopichia burtonii NRRL Y-1933]ODV65769.1 hypothetical protein HYPBUDRAFT_128913 [Hyphopichia burtonii NRRL Y-1933]
MSNDSYFSASSNNGDLGYNGFPVSINYFTAVPDLMVIKDAKMAIIFKSLLKKDSITKEKSMIELLNLISNEPSSVQEDELLVISWIQLYPKLSIDNSRNVRVLSHQIQGQLLNVIGGKNFSKYLKSSLPIWVAGLFDNDKTVSNSTMKTLLEAFQNDLDKVNNAIWFIFTDPILNYISTIVLSETHESLSDKRYVKEADSNSKYERVLNSAIMMLIKLIQLFNTDPSKFKNVDDLTVRAESLLNLDNLWDYLGKSVEPDVSNLTLFNNYLVLLKALFKLTPEKEANGFLKSLDDVKSVYKTVSKKFIKHVKLKPSNKSSTGGIIFSNVILQFWDTLTVLTLFAQLKSESKSIKIKKNFWEIGGSKSFSRLTDYLKLGHCQLSPIYYAVLKAFFTALADSQIKSSDDYEFLDFGNKKDAGSIFKILISQFKSLTSFEYKFQAISASVHIYKIFYEKTENKETLSKVNISLFENILDMLSSRALRESDKRFKKESISSFSQFLSNNAQFLPLLEGFNESIVDVSTSELEKFLKINDFEFASSTYNIASVYLDILASFSGTKGSQFAINIVEKIIDGLQENSALIKPVLAFEILKLYIDKNFKPNDDLREHLLEFIEQLPSFINPEFTSLPVELFSSVIDRTGFDNLDTEVLIDDFFTKISSENKDHLANFVIMLEEKKKLNFKDNDPIFVYAQNLSKKPQLTDQESKLIYKFTKNNLIFKNLVQSVSNDLGNAPGFIRHFVRDSGSISIDEADIQTQTSLKLIFSTIWPRIEDSDYQKFAELAQAPGTLHLLVESLFEYIHDSETDADFTNTAIYLSRNFHIFPLEKIKYCLLKAIEGIDINLLSIANPLYQNIHLISDADCTLRLDRSLLPIGKFLRTFLDIQESIEFSDEKASIIIVSGLVSEYLTDLNFLDQKTSSENELISVSHLLNQKFLSFFDSIEPSTLSGFVNGPAFNDQSSLQSSMLSNLAEQINVKDGYTKEHFYNCRLLRSILDKFSNNMSLSNFESLNIDLNKLVSYPLKCAAVLVAFSKFTTESTKFDRIRNFVAAEMLGVRSEEHILTQGLKWLTLSINFLNVDLEDGEKYEFIPQHRLAMVINQISKWLESDIAYDESFIVMRTQISRLFTGLLKLNSSLLPDKFWELAINLCQDNISTAQVEYAHIDLRHATFKLYMSLDKSFYKIEDSSLWKESKSSIVEELLELATNEELVSADHKLNNMPVLLSNELLNRLLIKEPISLSTIKEKKDQFYSLLFNAKYVSLQRIGTHYLEKLILESQQDFVVEYQLRKSNLGKSESDEDDNVKALLPQPLCESLQIEDADIEDFFVDDVPEKGFKYLFSWLLVFSHFKDVTYSIRTEYLNQLKQFNVIDKLFDIIFREADVSNTQTLKSFTKSRIVKSNAKIEISDNLIQEYAVSEGYPGEDALVEMRFLLIHLYYLSFQYLGSYVQSWFNSIRDRSLKQKIEKFSVNFTSPLIISKILEQISNSKEKLIGNKDNMTIKVNTVSNEIKSIYVIDEQTMEMIIKIPPSYPLASVTVEGPLRLGVKENQWKAWLLASQKIISLTNGSIIDAIELFNKNVDLHFSGFEDCAICYSILHQDHSLPSKTCPTCLNKFHAACLYKWFKSSGASSCPLCRSPFNFRVSRS